VNAVDPELVLLLSAGETVMATPLAGVVESTVSTYTVGGVMPVVELPLLPPQAVRNMLIAIPIQTAAPRLKFVMPMLPVFHFSRSSLCQVCTSGQLLRKRPKSS
jgi:hypothetical protein